MNENEVNEASKDCSPYSLYCIGKQDREDEILAAIEDIPCRSGVMTKTGKEAVLDAVRSE